MLPKYSDDYGEEKGSDQPFRHLVGLRLAFCTATGAFLDFSYELSFVEPIVICEPETAHTAFTAAIKGADLATVGNFA